MDLRGTGCDDNQLGKKYSMMVGGEGHCEPYSLPSAGKLFKFVPL
jgi:hypothetical protein